MKCPYCGNDLYSGAKFCNSCGSRTPAAFEASGGEIQSKEMKVLLALVKAVCFVMYFFGIQSTVMTAYMMTVCAEVIVPMITKIMDDSLDVYELTSLMASAIGEKIHETMILSGFLTVVILALVYKVRNMRINSEIKIARAPLPLLAKVAGCAVAMQFFVSVIIYYLPIPESLFEAFEISNRILMNGSPAVMFINIALVTPIVEEIVFRGFIYTRLRKAMGAVPSVIISGMIFGAVHGSLIGFCYASALGFFMALLMEKSDSILPCVVCHVFFNGASFATMLIPENTPVMLSVLALSAVCMALCLYLIFFRKAAKYDSGGYNTHL